MRSVVVILILLALFFSLWFYLRGNGRDNEGPKEKPIPESRHSKGFNASIASAMEKYYALTEDFVNWDSNQVKLQASVLNRSLDSLNLDDLKKDSTGISETASAFIAESKADADSIAMSGGILEQREWLNNLTQNLYDFLRSVKYDRSKLYLQQCPMAFNETEPGVWLSQASAIRNPYMGLHHPRYGKAMIECGEIKDTVNFIPAKK